MSAADLLRLVLLAACWGLAFVFIGVAVHSLGPCALVEVRALLASLVLFVYARLSGARLDLGRHWRLYLIIGALGSAIPFVLIALAQTVLSASYSVVLLSIAPLLSALVALLWIGERPSLSKIAGLLLGLAGVALLSGLRPASGAAPPIWAVLMALGAAALYGVAGVYSKRNASGIAPLALATGSQLGAAILLLPLAMAFPPAAAPTVVEWLNVVALALFSSALAFILYFHLIDSIGPVKTLSVNYLTPVFGVAGGVLALGEPLTVNLLGGMALILVGLTLVIGSARSARK